MIRKVHRNQNHLWNRSKVSRHFSSTDIKFYSIYSSSNLILSSSICPIIQPCYCSLFNNSTIIICSSIKISSRDKEISSILITICSRIKPDISIITSSRSCGNVKFESSLTSNDHNISSNTTS